ncbi:ribonuclease P [Methanocella sp. CWC-04]|uniref:Ribonuclease P protein component 3 n=1 Tax=Methanooceanicella nereidis TaxID=2052831 RepID=A0AAP2RGE9_9EURY|nr:ribonuclease P protein component 3 [Methanocella sp. CWC-04]MCD1296150.1 ribonuclease P [Methanocella sp. CWC-04]
MLKNDLRYYDLNVHAYPEGATTISRFINAAKNSGYSGICISYHSDLFQNIKDSYPAEEGFTVLSGVEISVHKANELRRQVDRYRNKVDVVLVHGGDEAINRAACEDSRVDILSHPHTGKTSGINHVIAKLAADKYVAVEFDLSYILCGKGGSRVKALSNYRTNLGLVKKYGAPYVITSSPRSLYDMRDIRSMISLCTLFDMSEEDAIKGLSYYPSEILKRNLPGTGYIMEGVELVQ